LGKKLTIDEVRDFFKSQGCVLLSNEYINAKIKLKYIASCKHEHEITHDCFQKGSGRLCPKCAKQKGFNKRKLCIKEVKKYFESKNCKLISNEYINSRSKLKYIATCGHENEVAFSKFKNGVGILCSKCSGGRRLIIEEVREYFKSQDCELLSNEYINAHNKLKYIAQCGHENEITYNSFQQGGGVLCPKCAKQEVTNSKKHSIEEVKIYFKSQKCELLSNEYINNSSILKYVASCGHENEKIYSDFQQGKGRLCPKCAYKEVGNKKRLNIEEVREYFESKDCKLLSSEYASAKTKLHYVAQCGHEHEIQYNNFKQGGGVLCPKCISSKGELSTSKILDNNNIKYEAQKTFNDCKNIKPLLFDFYLPEYNSCIEYDGIQHFESVKHFGGDDNLQEVQKRDNIKNTFCEQNNIPLLRIPYTITEEQDIQDIIINFINNIDINANI
jgi:Zn finger protein HypA/HybF involved in hydrogenase expression